MFENITKNNNLQNDMIEAVFNNNLEKVKEILSIDENIGVTAGEINGIPIMIHIAQNQQWEIFKECFNAGANLNVAIPFSGRTLLHEIVQNAPTKYIEYMLESVDNVNEPNNQGDNALMYAFKVGRTEVLDELLDSGLFNLKMRNKVGDTVLHIAAKNKQYDYFLKIIGLEPNIDYENNEGLTAIDCIEDLSFKESLPMMKKYIPKSTNVEQVSQSNPETNKDEALTPVVEEKPVLSGLSKITKKKPS